MWRVPITVVLVLAALVAQVGAGSAITRVIERTPPYDRGDVCLGTWGDQPLVTAACFQGTHGLDSHDVNGRPNEPGPTAAAWNGILFAGETQVNVPPALGRCIDPAGKCISSFYHPFVNWSSSVIFFRPIAAGTLAVTADIDGRTRDGTACLLIRVRAGPILSQKCDTFDLLGTSPLTVTVTSGELAIWAYIASNTTGNGNAVVHKFVLLLES